MKRKLSLILVLVFAMSMLTACGGEKKDEGGAAAGGEDKGGADEAKAYEVTFVAPVLGNDYWDGVITGVEDGAKEQGFELNVVSPGAKSDTVMSMDLCEAAIASGVDGLITGAYDADAVVPIFQKAADAGIPVVTLDCDSPQSSRIAYCGTSNYDAGFQVGEKMKELCEGKGEIIILTGSLTGDSALSRMQGFEDAIAGTEMKVVTKENTEGDALIAVQKAEAALNAYPDAVGCFGVQVNDGPGMGQAAMEAGRKMNIIGFDEVNVMMDAIREGYAYGTMVQNTHCMGALSCKLMKILLDGGTLEKEIYDTGVVMVTKEIVDDYVPALRAAEAEMLANAK